MARLLVWYGELATARSLFLRGLLLVLPGLLWLLAFLVLPGLLLLPLSLAERGSFGEVVWTFSLENYRRLLGFGVLGYSPDNLLALLRTLWVALVTTGLCLLLAYPIAFFIRSQPPRRRYLYLALVLIPFWTNLVIRTYAWQLLLAPEMPLARGFSALGWLEPGMALFPSGLAVYLGMVSAFLPFMVLPLYSSVERLDESLLEAVRDLYGGPLRVFLHGVLPQTLPGLTVGVILTFIPAMGMFVVPDLLGGAKHLLVGNLVQQAFYTMRDWPYGAALSLVLIVFTLVALRLYRRYGKEVELA
ncbi:MAG: ABC transporter permease [Thermus sp.]|uniref:ABC transporter permease n=1 Tax=unclassified Thermus TaxID=2619321 RepID=UPI000238A224|nr:MULTISPECIES: ABC transporter permease [unclassified Thermus]AEV16250.1 Spermidine/putrescine ABC transporter, permease protein [Thermus sp. CCB_US3_UF1]MCS7218552.1 ABC transporter permease [Thermus sp.]